VRRARALVPVLRERAERAETVREMPALVALGGEFSSPTM